MMNRSITILPGFSLSLQVLFQLQALGAFQHIVQQHYIGLQLYNRKLSA